MEKSEEIKQQLEIELSRYILEGYKSSEECQSFIDGYKTALSQPAQPKNLEDLKIDFFRKFGDRSFRGYSLDQCNLIFEHFLPHLTTSEQSSDKLNKQLDEWIESAKIQSVVFKDKDMHTASISSQAMAVAYSNVKDFLTLKK